MSQSAIGGRIRACRSPRPCRRMRSALLLPAELLRTLGWSFTSLPDELDGVSEHSQACGDRGRFDPLRWGVLARAPCDANSKARDASLASGISVRARCADLGRDPRVPESRDGGPDHRAGHRDAPSRTAPAIFDLSRKPWRGIADDLPGLVLKLLQRPHRIGAQVNLKPGVSGPGVDRLAAADDADVDATACAGHSQPGDDRGSPA